MGFVQGRWALSKAAGHIGQQMDTPNCHGQMREHEVNKRPNSIDCFFSRIKLSIVTSLKASLCSSLSSLHLDLYSSSPLV